MNSIKFFLIFCSALVLFASCKKDEPGGASINGTWVGKWGSGNQEPLYFLKFKFDGNGTLQRLDEQGAVIANGTWMLDGIQFECTYTSTENGQVHKIAGLYTDFDNTILGTWGYSPSKANGGQIELVKQ